MKASHNIPKNFQQLGTGQIEIHKMPTTILKHPHVFGRETVALRISFYGNLIAQVGANQNEFYNRKVVLTLVPICPFFIY